MRIWSPPRDAMGARAAEGPEGPGMLRRQFLKHAAAGCAALAPSLGRAESAQPLSIGTTPVFLDDDVAFLREWQGYLQGELGRPVVFVQRRSYREVSELLLAQKLDAAIRFVELRLGLRRLRLAFHLRRHMT